MIWFLDSLPENYINVWHHQITKRGGHSGNNLCKAGLLFLTGFEIAPMLSETLQSKWF
jgi:hypothetical protein